MGRRWRHLRPGAWSGSLADGVADAADGADRAVGAELAAQLRDVHVDGPAADGALVAPHLAEQLLPLEHATGAAHQMREQVELGRGQLDLVGADPRPALAGVEPHAAGTQHGLDAPVAARPAQD